MIYKPTVNIFHSAQIYPLTDKPSCKAFLQSIKNTQLTFTYSKSARETRKKGVKHVQSWCHSGAFKVNFEHISHLFLMFLLLLWVSKHGMWCGTDPPAKVISLNQ